MRFLSPVAALILLLPACAVAGPSDPAVPRGHLSAPRPVSSEAGVWYPGATKAYVFRRYVDPANPRILHESHVVYRREDDGGFILRPAGVAAIGRGPSAGLSRGEADRRGPLTNELRAELARQRAATTAINGNAQKLFEAKEQIVEAADEIKALARKARSSASDHSEAERQRDKQIREIEERLRRLEDTPSVSPAPVAPPAETPTDKPNPPRR